jgi:hypothetical protein
MKKIEAKKSRETVSLNKSVNERWYIKISPEVSSLYIMLDFRFSMSGALGWDTKPLSRNTRKSM